MAFGVVGVDGAGSGSEFNSGGGTINCRGTCGTDGHGGHVVAQPESPRKRLAKRIRHDVLDNLFLNDTFFPLNVLNTIHILNYLSLILCLSGKFFFV